MENIEEKIHDLSVEVLEIKELLDEYAKKDDIKVIADLNEITNKIKITVNEMKDEMDTFATKSELNSIDLNIDTESFVSKDFADLTYAKKDDIVTDLNSYLKKSEISSFINLNNYASKSELKNALTNYAKSSDVNSISDSINNIINTYDFDSFVTKEYVLELINSDEDIPEIDLSAYAKKEELKNLVTNSKFKTTLSEYAKLSDIHSVDTSDFATKTELDEVYNSLKDDITRIENLDIPTLPSLSEFLKISDSKNFITNGTLNSVLAKYQKKVNTYTKTEADSKFLDKDDAKKIYLKIDDAKNEYLSIDKSEDMFFSKLEALKTFMTIEDYRGIKNAATLNMYYRENRELFEKMLDAGSLFDGFYVIGDDINIVKGNELFSLGGGGSYSLKWKVTNEY